MAERSWKVLIVKPTMLYDQRTLVVNERRAACELHRFFVQTAKGEYETSIRHLKPIRDDEYIVPAGSIERIPREVSLEESIAAKLNELDLRPADILSIEIRDKAKIIYFG